MEVPQKDNECEKQLMESVENDEYQIKAVMSEFNSWRRKIKPLYEILGTGPDDSPLGKLILDGTDSQYFVQLSNDNLIRKCQELYGQLMEQVELRKREAFALWNELQGMWTELENKEEYGLCFTNAEAGIFNSIQQLKAQFNARKIEKSRKLSEFIGELRKEISDIWEQCMITEDEKAQFVEFNSCEFSEEMLQIHKEELTKWKVYHKKNHEILQKTKKRDAMWKRLRELEAKASDPSRFVNRGGSLLKDQNMHNYIMKTLPKVENELISLAKIFESEHGKKMKILGEEIPVMIERDWQKFKDEKSRKPRTAPTPTKTLNMRRSMAPAASLIALTGNNNANPPFPLIRPLEKRFGSRQELTGPVPVKRTKVQSCMNPMKAMQNDANR